MNIMEKNFANYNETLILYNLQRIRQICFEVTEKCNLRCVYCGYSDIYEGFADDRKKEDLNFLYAKNLIDYIFNLWNDLSVPPSQTTISFYGGEPLLAFDLIKQIINYCESLYKGVRIINYSMTTNGVLLNKYMNYIVEKKFNLLISMDGDEPSHSYRVDTNGNNSFQKVYKNIQLLKNNYKAYYEKYVRFNAVLHNRNEFEDILLFFNEHFQKVPQISSLKDTYINSKNLSKFNFMYKNYTDSYLASKDIDAVEKIMYTGGPKTGAVLSFLKHYSGNIFQEYRNLLYSASDSIRFPTGTCSPFGKKIFITVRGLILHCERISHNFALGKVTTNNVLLNYRNISIRYNKYLKKFEKQCAVCARASHCNICILSLSPARLNSGNCGEYITEKDNEQYNKKVLLYLKKNPELYEKLLTKTYTYV